MNKIQYASSSSEDEETATNNTMIVNPNPKVALPTVQYKLEKELAINLPLKEISKPLQGPMNPYVPKQERNMLSGHAEDYFMNDQAFYELTRNYENKGHTFIDEKMVVNAKKVAPLRKRQKRDMGDASNESFQGPWAKFEGDIHTLEIVPKNQNYVPDPELLFDRTKIEESEETKPKIAETSILHGKEQLDYLGRSWTYPPQEIQGNVNLRSGQVDECFIPKKLIHTWKGHNKGVNVIKFFPKSAHLILSGSMDTKVKIWDVYRERNVRRTYLGHSRGVKDATFDHNGEKFLSASYDKFIKLWDTETGKCLSKFTSHSVPQCITYHPDPSKHAFLAGCQDNKIYQFDTRTNDIVQKYEQHTGMINSITFIEENQRFVSSSDDKSLRAWEFGIPIVIKYVAEPDMQTITAVSLSHNRKWLACQCLDNKIMIISALDKLRVNRKKLFSGHLVAGFQCKPSFSPDNRFVFSGDSEGTMWYWDWKTNKVFKKYKAHDGAIGECLWNPNEKSRVATCSWDGTIKYWD